jgi:acyl-CoA synthetase (AMP-forming)/AMP-acid ligase II
LRRKQVMSKRLLLKELSRYNVGTWADIIYRNALLHPNDEAFVYGDRRITFAEYNTRINKVIHGLHKMGVKKGDVLGILSWSCLEFAEIYGLTMKGGFIASPFNPRLGKDELEYLIKYSETETIFVGKELVEMANSLKERLPQVKNFISLETAAPGMTTYDDIIKANSGEEPDIELGEDDPCCIIYTSGTTGVPRGALYTQRRFIEDSKILSINMSLQEGHKRVQITPLFHIAGNTHFRSSLFTAGCNAGDYPAGESHPHGLRAHPPGGDTQPARPEKTRYQLVAVLLVRCLAHASGGAQRRDEGLRAHFRPGLRAERERPRHLPPLQRGPQRAGQAGKGTEEALFSGPSRYRGAGQNPRRKG